MKNYNLLYQNENQNEKDSLIFYKKMFSKQTRHIPEMMVFHIFLTKKYAEKSIKKSFQDINLNDNKRGINSFINISRFSSVKNTLLFLSAYSNFQSLFDKDYCGHSSISEFLNIEKEIKTINKYDWNKKNREILAEKNQIFKSYINSLHLNSEEFFEIFAKLASYFLSLLEEFNSEYQKISDFKKNPFYKFKNSNSEKVMFNIIVNNKGRQLEKRLIKSYNVKTEKKALKSKDNSLIFHYISDKRLYKKIIWRKNKKPVFYNYMPGFFNNIYSLSTLININHLFLNETKTIFALKLISAEIILNQNIIKLIK